MSEEEWFGPEDEQPKKKQRRAGDAQPTSFWLDDETKSILNRLKRELGLNRSAVVREAIRRMDADDQTAEVRRLVADLQRVVGGQRLGT